MSKKRIGIFASGSGTNAERIVRHFSNDEFIEVSLILSNNPNAYVLKRAESFGIPFLTFTREQLYNSDDILEQLHNHKIDFIVLAGFLWLVPVNLIRLYPEKIVNIHPALLPKYGGKGMYGDKVHKAVKLAGDTESGITIHWVNEKYDDGQIIFQARCDVSPEDTPESIADKVHSLEYQHYPSVIESLLKS